jgi:hypothetical protein
MTKLNFRRKKKVGANQESNQEPLAPEARIIPLDHQPLANFERLLLVSFSSKISVLDF